MMLIREGWLRLSVRLIRYGEPMNPGAKGAHDLGWVFRFCQVEHGSLSVKLLKRALL